MENNQPNWEDVHRYRREVIVKSEGVLDKSWKVLVTRMICIRDRKNYKKLIEDIG